MVLCCHVPGLAQAHLCRYWQQQDPTELLVTAPQEAASQAGGHLGQTSSHLEPPLLAEPLTMAQAMEQIPTVPRVLPRGQAGTLAPLPWPAPFPASVLAWGDPDCQEAGPAIPRAAPRECELVGYLSLEGWGGLTVSSSPVPAFPCSALAFGVLIQSSEPGAFLLP